MAVTWPTPVLLNGHLVDEEDWEVHTDNLDDLNTRIGTGNGTALATRIGTLETTVNAAGSTAAGNAALSTRLGTGVTTSNTATSQFAAITANLGTWSGGTAISRIGALESAVGIPWSGGTALSRVTALEGRGVGKYQLVMALTADQSTATGGYHKITWPTPTTNVGFGTIASGQSITIPETGWYEIGISLRYGVSATGYRAGWVSLTSDAESTRHVWAATEGFQLVGSGQAPKIQDSQAVKLTAGTVLAGWSIQTSGGALSLLSFAGACQLKILYLCP